MRCRSLRNDRRERLMCDDDVAVLEDIDRQLAVARQDLADGFALRMTGVEKVLLDMEVRGHTFFEDTLRLGRVMDLFNRARVQKEFEDRVVADAPRQIERRVSELRMVVDQDSVSGGGESNVGDRVASHAHVCREAEIETFHYDVPGSHAVAAKRKGLAILRQATEALRLRSGRGAVTTAAAPAAPL